MYQEGFPPIVALQFFFYGRKEAKIYNGVIFTDGLIDGTYGIYGYGVESYYPTSIIIIR